MKITVKSSANSNFFAGFGSNSNSCCSSSVEGKGLKQKEEKKSCGLLDGLFNSPHANNSSTGKGNVDINLEYEMSLECSNSEFREMFAVIQNDTAFSWEQAKKVVYDMVRGVKNFLDNLSTEGEATISETISTIGKLVVKAKKTEREVKAKIISDDVEAED